MASLLRGSEQNVAELVRIGTQIERDFGEARRYWSNVNTDSQKKKVQPNKDSGPKSSLANTRVVQCVQQPVQPQFKMITLPILLRNRFFSSHSRYRMYAIVNSRVMLEAVASSRTMEVQ